MQQVTIVLRDTTDTLTNKTLTSPDINTPDIDSIVHLQCSHLLDNRNTYINSRYNTLFALSTDNYFKRRRFNCI